ncbi:MAG: class I SAM-dependent methyltransferase [Candidatus Dormibacteria bacterium]
MDSDDQWAAWLLEDRFGPDPEIARAVRQSLVQWRDLVLRNARLREGETLLDVGTGDGLIGFGALELLGPQGRVIFSDVSDVLLERCREQAEQRGLADRCEFIRASVEALDTVGSASVDAVTSRSVLMHVSDKAGALRECHRVLRNGGRLSAFEAVQSRRMPSSQTAYWGYDLTSLAAELPGLRQAVALTQPAPGDPMSGFDEQDLIAWAEAAGFAEIRVQLLLQVNRPSRLRDWNFFYRTSRHPGYPTLEAAAREALSAADAERLAAELRPLVEAGAGVQREALVYLVGVKA